MDLPPIDSSLRSTAMSDNAQAKKKSLSSAELVNVQEVAEMLCCSTRHVYRLSDGGRMPRPFKLGSLVRWSRAVVEAWIIDGCRSCRKGVRA